MNKNNFIDPETKEEFLYMSYKMIPQTSGINIYKDKYGKQIINPANGNILQMIPDEVKIIEAPMFISSDKAKRMETLQKRSSEHFKKEISESKYEKNKALIKNFKGK